MTYATHPAHQMAMPKDVQKCAQILQLFGAKVHDGDYPEVDVRHPTGERSWGTVRMPVDVWIEQWRPIHHTLDQWWLYLRHRHYRVPDRIDWDRVAALAAEPPENSVGELGPGAS